MPKMDLLNAKGELVPDEPKVVIHLNPDQEVVEFSTTVSSRLSVVIIKNDPAEYKKQTVGLPFHTPSLASLQSKKQINN
jgi:hypothetical protein